MAYVAHLKCSKCGHTHSHHQLLNLCPDCQSPLLVEYDWDRLEGNCPRSGLSGRPPDMWRYLEMLPVEDRREIITLGEGMTPLIRMHRLERDAGGRNIIYAKDESLNPTGSFKARGLSAAVTMARKLGATKLSIPSAGNAGGALASYGAYAGLETYVFIPKDTPVANVIETQVCATHCELVDGLISDAAKRMNERKETENWFDVSTLKEPYRIEGKKTMGYEIAEQLDWQLPDVIFYPTGGGTGLIGMWKAFDEMERLGWIDDKRPRMVAVQSDGCAPIVKAFETGAKQSEFWPDPETFASGIRVPKALGDFLILQALYDSRGTAVAVSDEEIREAIGEVGKREGLFFCPEGAACWVAFRKLLKSEWIEAGEHVVVFNTGAGTKYVDSLARNIHESSS